MKRKWKVLTLTGILAVTCGLYTWGIPAVVNIKSHKSFIEQKVFENSGFIVDIGNPELSMGVFPSVWVKSDNISILNSDGTKALSIDNPQLKIKLFPLLFKKIEIANVSATKEDINFVLTKDSKFLLGQYPLDLKFKKDNKFTLNKIDWDLGSYNISLADNLNNQQVKLQGRYFEHGKYIQNKHIKFSTEGSFEVGKKSTDYMTDVSLDFPLNHFTEDQLMIMGRVDNFDLASISDYVNILSSGRIKKMGGIVNYSASTTPDKFGHKKIESTLRTNNLVIEGKDKASSIIYPKELTAKLNFRTIENGIHFENTSLQSDKIHAFVDGKIFNIGEKVPNLNITASVENTRLEDVVAILPGSEKLLPDFNLYKLKKYVFYGDGEGKVSFQGKANRPHLKGYVKLSNAYLIKPLRGAPDKASIDLNFNEQLMDLNVFVPTSVGQNVTVKGKVKIDGSKYSELFIKSTDSVILEPVEEILNPLHEILKFQLGPVPMMKISGIGNIDMHSAGKKVDPHIWGKITFRNATASFNDVHNLVLNNGSGEVVFDDTKVSFRSYKAFINGKPVEIKGNCVVLGDLNVYVTAKGQNIQKLAKTINTSPILVDVQKAIAPFTHPTGVADVFLHIYGKVKNADEVVFNEDLFSKGTVTLHNATTVMQDTYLPFTNVNGVVNFDKYNSDYDVNGFVRNSKIYVKGTGEKNQIDLVAKSQKFAIKDCNDLLYPTTEMPFKKEIGMLNASFVGSYKGIADGGELDYDKVKVDGKFIPNMNTNAPIRLNGGTFTIRNGVLKTSNLKGLFNNNPFNLTLTMADIYDSMTIASSVFNFKNFDISSVNEIKKQVKLPKQYAAQLDNITDMKGIVDISGTINNGKIWSSTNLKDTSFVYKPLGAVVRILNGEANMRGDTLYLKRVNSRVSSMPVFVDGSVADVFGIPKLNLLVSAKPTQTFFDRFINNKSVYPVKLKGDVNFNSKLRGPIDRISAHSNLNIGENSSIYYMGATLAGAPNGAVSTGELTTNPVSVVSDVVLRPNSVHIDSLKYNQTIMSQSQKKSIQNQLVASGDVTLLNDNVLGFKNFKVKTSNPTNAKIFNVLLKKPTIKQGVFTTDLTLNGTSLAPKILGDLNISSVDIPLLDATIRDININFKNDYIDILTKGVILTNDIVMKAKVVNNPTPPFVIEDVNVQMDELNLNVITQALSDFEADNTRNKHLSLSSANPVPMPIDQLVIKNAQLNADKILIKKATATNFSSNMSLSEDNVAKINDYHFNIANGEVNGKINYDLKTFSGNAEMTIKNADAQIIGENFFDLPGQMYGHVTGDMHLSCNGLSSVECVNTLSGGGSFEVRDGRMPKLGSLEYLLKAGNLITGGITGLSINGIIDLITPLKTGNFDKISGEVKVENGIANDINVYSSGKDLNMYMTGNYNLSTFVADMEVYGSLSKNFSTLLGKIGNSSLNRLFNTIPGININDINPSSTSKINKIPNFEKANVLRVFKAEIFGDINGSNYVKSFRWIKN